LPINVSGGLKSKGHPVGATGVSMHVTAARLLTGEAGAMNLDRRPELGLCFNMGGGAVASCVSILEQVKG
jgi:acetyl-CoA C-acetyltransferase